MTDHAKILELKSALRKVSASLAWLAHGDCRAFDDAGPILSSSEAVDLAKSVLGTMDLEVEMSAWLSACPRSIITNLDSETPLRHIAMTSIAYPKDILILTEMKYLLDMNTQGNPNANP